MSLTDFGLSRGFNAFTPGSHSNQFLQSLDGALDVCKLCGRNVAVGEHSLRCLHHPDVCQRCGTNVVLEGSHASNCMNHSDVCQKCGYNVVACGRHASGCLGTLNVRPLAESTDACELCGGSGGRHSLTCMNNADVCQLCCFNVGDGGSHSDQCWKNPDVILDICNLCGRNVAISDHGLRCLRNPDRCQHCGANVIVDGGHASNCIEYSGSNQSTSGTLGYLGLRQHNIGKHHGCSNPEIAEVGNAQSFGGHCGDGVEREERQLNSGSKQSSEPRKKRRLLHALL